MPNASGDCRPRRARFASIYFDDSHDTEDAAALRELRWRAAREQLAGQGADEETLAGIERAILDAAPPAGRSGRGMIVAADGVLVDERLLRAFPSATARWSQLPYIVPIVEHQTYLVAAVDHTGADITVHRGNAVRSETVAGGGYPVHHAHLAESAGYGDPQRTAEGEAQRNIRAVSQRLTAIVDHTGAEAVFVIGEVRSRADLIADLPERVATRVTELAVGARHSGIDDEAVREASPPSSYAAPPLPASRPHSAWRRSYHEARGWPPKDSTAYARRCARARSTPCSSETWSGPLWWPVTI